MSHALIVAATTLFLIPGLFMAFVPMLPALSYMLIVALVFGLFDSFVSLSYVEFAILVALALLSIVIDHLSGILGAKYGGAHGTSLVWGLVGSIVGTFIAPFLGSLAGLFIGVAARELSLGRGKTRAAVGAGSALVGSLAGIVVNVGLAFVFIALFVGFAVRY